MSNEILENVKKELKQQTHLAKEYKSIIDEIESIINEEDLDLEYNIMVAKIKELL